MLAGLGLVVRDDVVYVDTAEAVRQLAPDVTEDMIRNWVKRKILTPVGRMPGRSNIYRLTDAAEAERRTRQERRGRRRRAALAARVVVPA